MILIADSGSTKTDWRLIDDNRGITQHTTQGLNPYFISGEGVVSEIKNVLLPQFKAPVSTPQVFFYGSGCGAEEKKKLIHDSLLEVFPGAGIKVHTDLLGAARGLCGKEKGIVAILGTGSNACYYDGEHIVSFAASLGYVLGDEGSGAHIGKSLISALLHKKLSFNVEKDFYKRFQMHRDELLENIYRKPFPNRFLASFSKFAFQHVNEACVADLVAGCFREFFEKQVKGLTTEKNVKFNCSGSVGFYFSNMLRRVAEEKHVTIGRIVDSPIAALGLYHMGE